MFDKLFKGFGPIVEKKNKEDVSEFEAMLYEKYGKSYLYRSYGLKWLFIADTHGRISMEALRNIRELSNECSSVIFMGDHSDDDLKYVIERLPAHKPMYGILGNHDRKDLYTGTQIQYIGNEVSCIDDIFVAAFDGSVKYKESDTCMYTQEEMEEISKDFGICDICLSHANPYINDNSDLPNQGYKALTEYVYKNRIPRLIHGHIHELGEYRLYNKSRVKCVYGVEVIEI